MIFVISGPAGSGKTTLSRTILDDNTIESVSFTSRPKRKSEVDGVDYNFLTKEEFWEKIEAAEMVEWAEVHGNCYGTSKVWLQEQLDAGKNVVAVLDTVGASRLWEQFQDQCTTIFILPPSSAALRKRLEDRGEDSPEAIEIRLANSENELMACDQYDYLLMNNDLEVATQELADFVNSVNL